MTDASRLKSTVFVGGLPPNTTTQILHATFIPFGDIVDITIPKPDSAKRRDDSSHAPHSQAQASARETNRGFGYVEFESAADAKEAIDNMDQSELFGRVIRVAEAKPQRDGAAIGSGTGEGLGSRTALWLQEGYLAANAVDQEDRLAARQAQQRDMQMDGGSGGGGGGNDDDDDDDDDDENYDERQDGARPDDPMQGLEGLDVAGPKDA